VGGGGGGFICLRRVHGNRGPPLAPHWASEMFSRANAFWPAEEVTSAAKMKLILNLEGGRKIYGWPKADGAFSLTNVPEGTHLLDVVASGLVYPQVPPSPPQPNSNHPDEDPALAHTQKKSLPSTLFPVLPRGVRGGGCTCSEGVPCRGLVLEQALVTHHVELLPSEFGTRIPLVVLRFMFAMHMGERRVHVHVPPCTAARTLSLA